MLNTPFSPWPSFTRAEADAVSSVILSNRVNYWTGQECREFEKEFAQYFESKYAIALSNGTLALDLALHALDIGPGDEVIVTSRTFLASASCIVNAGAKPVFADVDLDSQNITAETIKKVITEKTRAIMCVHLAGWPCDMDGIMELAKNHNLYVIEDCAQAHGAKYNNRSVGTFGDVAAWSFCQDKIMTTGGEGGMVTTNSRDLWAKMWAYKDHGKSYAAVYERQHAPGFRWLHESFGSNFRMMEVQGVIGRIQLKKMPEWVRARNQNAETIRAAAKNLPGLRVPDIPANVQHAAYKCYVFVQADKLKSDWNRDRIMNEVVARGVPCYSGSCSEIYLEKAFDDTGFRPEERLPNAKLLGETSLMFLVHPTLTNQEIEKTCAVLTEVMNLATNN